MADGPGSALVLTASFQIEISSSALKFIDREIAAENRAGQADERSQNLIPSAGWGNVPRGICGANFKIHNIAVRLRIARGLVADFPH